MPEFRKEIILETEIGQVKAVSLFCADALDPNQISLKAITFTPSLPPQMSVRKCTALLLTIDQPTTIQRLNFSLSLDSKILGSPCTGECLEAQEWNDGDKLLVIGTEDSQALTCRLPLLCKQEEVLNYTPHSLTLNLHDLPKSKPLSFHFILAENNIPEPEESSAWFAVDQKHSYLLQQVLAQQA
jgi:hypothetical protein